MLVFQLLYAIHVLPFRQPRPFIEYSMLRLTFQVYFALSFHITSHVHRIHFFVPLCCIGLRFSPCHLEDLVNPLDPPLLQIDITLGIQSRVGTITKSKLPVIFLVLEQHICLNELESDCVPHIFTSRPWLSFCSVSFFEFYANNFNCDTENSSFLVQIQGNNYHIIFMLCLILQGYLVLRMPLSLPLRGLIIHFSNAYSICGQHFFIVWQV